MTLNFIRTPETLEDLLTVGRVTDEQARQLHAAFTEVIDRIETPDGLLAIALDVVPDFEVASALVEQLLSVNHLSRRIGQPVATVIDSELGEISELLEDKDQAKQMLQSVAVLRRLSDLVAFRKTSKALELVYDCDNLLQRTRIMTDVRPVFSDDPSKIEGAVVSHTLRIQYDSAGNDREMSLALDDRDLRKLIADCERALVKADAARIQMCGPSNIPTMNIAEEQSD